MWHNIEFFCAQNFELENFIENNYNLSWIENNKNYFDSIFSNSINNPAILTREEAVKNLKGKFEEILLLLSIK